MAKSRQGVTLQSKGCERSNNHHPKQRRFYEDLHCDSYFGGQERVVWESE